MTALLFSVRPAAGSRAGRSDATRCNMPRFAECSAGAQRNPQQMDPTFADGRRERLPGLAAELVGLKVDLNAKNSTAVSTIPKAQETGRLKVVTRAHVTSISVDTEGRATGVMYVQDGQEYLQPADVVLFAGYTYENVRMLLLSKSKPYPNGLSNNHGQVGKHYMTHNTLAGVTALFPWNLNTWYGLPAQGVAVDNWAELRPCQSRLHRRWEPLGVHREATGFCGKHGHVRQGAGLWLDRLDP